MAYQVLARKYRPQRFDDVVGQRGVTQTLRNALVKKRLAQAFVFAGPRGVGKTTTARILARALCCDQGPTPDPCGTCDPCVEITAGRDIDVLEIDAATHTQVENVREVIIAGLAIAPVRDRYKIFIIDEFHQLSSHSFNALLKSIEEPPPHVVFMMATTELQKIPETILSRSQVFEFRTISTQTIADQLRSVATAEKITVDEAALGLIARAAEGSMRDAQSAFDQVIAFAGDEITSDAVSTVLGLIGREPVLDIIEVVASEDPTAVFERAGRFVEAGYDLRLVCRELTRAVRDLLVLLIDPNRADDPEIAAESERARLLALSRKFSREDLLRAFDVLAKAEFDIRAASQPRYHLEMALLKWMHLRRLVPLAELLQGGSGGGEAPPPPRGSRPSSVRRAAARPAAPARRAAPPERAAAPEPESPALAAGPAEAAPARPAEGDSGDKAAVLAEIKRAKKFFYGTVIAQAQRIDLDGDRLVFSFSKSQVTLASQLTQSRGWLEALATKATGRRVTVATAQGDADTPPAPVTTASPASADAALPGEALRERALSDSLVQTVLEVFPAEIKDIEKL